MNTGDSEILVQMAEAYVAFLVSFPWDRPLVVSGAREGLNKFLSNAYLASFRPRRKKHALTQLISVGARDRINGKDMTSLVFEHVVPKRKYIQDPCELRACNGQLTTEFVLGCLKTYWVLATVTKEEDGRLTRSAMPRGWDEQDILARYAAAGIQLLPNPFAAPGVPSYMPSVSAWPPNNRLPPTAPGAIVKRRD